MKQDQKIYITYDAGNMWIVERYNSTVDWHAEEYQGSKAECEREAHYQNNVARQSHYRNFGDVVTLVEKAEFEALEITNKTKRGK